MRKKYYLSEKSYLYVCNLIIILVLVACKAYPVSTSNMSKHNTEYFITNDLRLSKLSYGEIFEYGKSIIPTLIDSIESDSLVVFSMRINPAISDLRPFINQFGVRSAYAIELILAKDSINPISDTIFVDLEAKHVTKREIIKYPYCIFNFGIIKKVDADFNSPLTHQDMIKIQKMYRDWWEDNKKKSLDQLRKEYRDGNIILKNPYYWI